MWNNLRELNRLTSVLLSFSILVFMGIGWRQLGHSSLFNVTQLVITTPVEHVTPDQVRAALNQHLHGNFISLHLGELREAFEHLPWVRRVSLRRVWPNRLDVAIEEHEVFARWGNTKLMNRYGELFDGATNNRELPILSGPIGSEFDVRRRYEQFSKATQALNLAVQEVSLDERYAWRIYLSNNIALDIGRDLAKESSLQRIERFVRWYPQTIQRIQQTQRSIKYVDLRYPHGFAVGFNHIEKHLAPPRKTVSLERT